MVKPANTQAIEKETGASWQAWCAFLDDSGAAERDHNGIVRLAHAYAEISGWWAQEIAVAYEQHIGRRKPGQKSDGLFSASVSRTVALPSETAFDRWSRFASVLDEIGGKQVARQSTSRTTKRLYWRCKFDDGSAVSVGFEPKGDAKARIGIEHDKLRFESDIAKAKSDWAAKLKICFDL